MSSPRERHGDEPDLVTIGETLVMLTTADATPLSAARSLEIHVGGAESNVATYLVELGHRSRWYSRLGDDPFGAIVLTELRRSGVDTSTVTTVVGGQTGVYVKDPAPHRTAVYYFREQSAARDLNESVLLDERLLTSRILHLTGITPALSASARRMTEAGIFEHRSARRLVSFDVNYRQPLWPVQEAAPLLARLAGGADIAFVGLDEAQVLWGCETATDVRELLYEVPTVVVKDGSFGAYSFTQSGETFVPSPTVRVLEPVGAGDAFAAGYLAGVLEDRPEMYRLRLGHLVAAAALSVPSDHGALPPRSIIADRCVLSEQAWAGLDLRAEESATVVQLADHVSQKEHTGG